jgi:hypothetical protein
MTEADWNSCSDPQAMLDWLRQEGKLSERKARLFACACCRRIWHLLTDERSRRAVEVAERYADGVADEDERFNAWEAACEAGMADEADAGNAAEAASRSSDESTFARDAALEAASAVAFGDYLAARDAVLASTRTDQDGFYSDQDCDRAADAGRAAQEVAMNAEAAVQCHLLRDIFGNPFRSAATDPGWLTPTVVELARTIYEVRAFNRFPILADALEQAGCTSKDILNHCRQPGEHVRGCWLVDALLAKE